MIKGLAKLEFGNGDIRMTSVLSNQVGALVCLTQDKHKIGETVPIEDDWHINIQAEVILTFTKVESIDVVILKLNEIKAMMDGTYNFKDGKEFDQLLDLDAFMKKGEFE